MPGVTPAEVLSNFGITLVEDPAENQPRLLVDLPAAELVEHAIRREEGRMASNGALVIETGERTGRSPNDRFIVDTPDVHDKIAWGAVNRPLSAESYEAIKAGIVDYLNERDVFVTRGMAGADRNHTRRLLVACERASQALFIKQMLARPLAREIRRAGLLRPCRTRLSVRPCHQGPQLQRRGGHQFPGARDSGRWHRLLRRD